MIVDYPKRRRTKKVKNNIIYNVISYVNFLTFTVCLNALEITNESYLIVV